MNDNKRIKFDYNLVFFDNALKVDEDLKIVFVPLDYYFLM
ncbi:MAG: hypothetical protein MNSN_08790 [Minisyncoccus archaeiphilus]|nr:MAG: hypothetical protein MNSN_08790 [Candidatus Parcubacteria bacterium]